jgi:hypothetical protein
MPAPGPDKVLCGAKTKSGSCGMVAGARTDHLGAGRCFRHGGNTPNGKAYGAKLNLQRQATTALAKLGEAGSIQPIRGQAGALDKLEYFAGYVTAMLEWSHEKIAALKESRYEAVTGEQIRGEWQLHMQIMQQFKTTMAEIVKLDLDRRRIELVEAQVNQLQERIDRVLNNRELALSTEQIELFEQLLAKEFGWRAGE